MTGALTAVAIAWVAVLSVGAISFLCRSKPRFARMLGASAAWLMVVAFLFMVITGRFMAASNESDDPASGCGGALVC